MKIKTLNTYNSLLFILLFFTILTVKAQVPTPPAPKKIDSTKVTEVKIDTIKRDSIVKLPYSFKPFQKGSLFLNELNKFEVIYDAEKGHYIFVEKNRRLLYKTSYLYDKKRI